MSKPRVFKQINTSDRNLQLIQANIEQAISESIRAPLLNGVLLENISIASGNNTVEHKLGRKYRGYSVVLSTAAITTYDAGNAQPELYLNLNSSAAATVSLWVF